MSMKRFFIMLLALILCLSMFMTACGDDAKKDKDDDEEEEEEASSSDEKQLIIDKIAAFNIMDIIDTAMSNLNSGNVNTALDDIWTELAGVNAEADLDLTVLGETGNLYAGFKDNVFQGVLTAPDGEEEGAYLYIKDGAFFAFNEYENGTVEINKADMGLDMSDLGDIDMSEITNQIEEILSVDVKEALRAFKFPDLKKDDLTKDGDFYYIDEDYYSKVAEDVLNLVINVMKAAGAPASELPSEAELDSALAMINEIVSMANIKIGFAAGKEEICGFAFSVDLDVNEIAEYFEGSAEDIPAVSPSPEPAMAYEEDEIRVKASIEALCTKDLSALEYFKIMADVTAEGMTVKVSTDFNAIINKSNELKGVEFVVDVNINNVSVSGMGESEGTNGDYTYYYTNVYGDISTKLSGTIDFSNPEKVGSKLIGLDFTFDLVPTYAEKHDEYGNEYDTDIDITEFATAIDADASLTVKSKGSATLDVNIVAESKQFEDAEGMGSRQEILVDGTINWLSAPGFKALPSEISNAINSDLNTRYETAIENAENMRYTIYNPSSSQDDYYSYLWYDSESGLYVILNSEYSSYLEVFTQIPPREMYYAQYK